MITSIYRLLRMYSFYICIFAYAKLSIKNTNRYFWDIISANAIIIGSAVTLFYIYQGPKKVKKFYDELFVPLPLWVWLIIDFFVHYVPIVILGFPRLWWSFPIAFIMVTMYFIAIKSQFWDIYRIDISKKTIEKLITQYGTIYVLVLSVITYCKRNDKVHLLS